MRYGNVLGFPVVVHPTWLIVFALLIVSLVSSVSIPGVARLPDAESLVVGALVVVLFIASMVAHELAHAIVARRRGVLEPRIRLLTPGGAESDVGVETARTELIVAIVGPLTSVVIAGTCLGLAAVLPAAGEGTLTLVFWTLLWAGLANLVLAGFHLMPAVPLDGGRAVRALALAWTHDSGSATRIAAAVGRAFGIGLVGSGLIFIFVSPEIFVGIWLVLLGWFTSRLANGSVERQRMGELTAGLTVSDLIDPDVPTVPAAVTLNTLLREEDLDPRNSGVYTVMDGDEVVGVIETRSLRRSIWGRQGEQRVGDIAIPLDALTGLSPSTALMSAVERFEIEGTDVLMVVESAGEATLMGVLRRATVLERLRKGQAVVASGIDP